MGEEINSILQQTENKLDISILGAWETGSRAYGFDNNNSDYDVTVVFQQNTDSYILEDDYTKGFCSEDVTISSTKDIDIDGWDIRQFRDLLLSYDPMVYETLLSPKSYRTNQMFENLSSYACNNMNPIDLFNKYQRASKHIMSQREREDGQIPNKYLFHIARDILIARYIKETHKYPNLKWPVFLKSAPDSIFVEFSKDRINNLTQRKQSPHKSKEYTYPDEKDELKQFFNYELNYEEHIIEQEITPSELNKFIRQMLNK